jgi:hypothetical protein
MWPVIRGWVDGIIMNTVLVYGGRYSMWPVTCG